MNELVVDDQPAAAWSPSRPGRTNMLWVAWRQQRFQLLVCLALIGTVALGLVFLRLNVIGAIQGANDQECYLRTDRAGCTNAAFGFISDHYGKIATYVPLLMLALPPILGALLGGPLFAREYEQGTHILALTQSVSPVRWWVVKTAVAGVPVALAMLALGFVNRWALEPMTAFVSRAMTTPGFETRGMVPAGYFVLAFGLAVTAGILLRNTVAAIGSAIVGYVVLLLIMGFFRLHYLTPEQLVLPVSADSAQDVSTSPDLADSVEVDNYFVDAAGQRVVVHFQGCLTPDQTGQCIADQGAVAEVISYQPANRYWPIQGIEAGLSICAAAAVLGLGLFRLRRRVR